MLLGIRYSLDRHVLCRRWVLVWWHYHRYQLVVRSDCFWIPSVLPVLINCCHLLYAISEFGLILCIVHMCICVHLFEIENCIWCIRVQNIIWIVIIYGVNITICIIGCIIRRFVFFKFACTSSCFCRTWSISFGIRVFDRPTLGAHPSIASYGDRFIPTWSRLFFWNYANFMPLSQFTSISLDLSTLP